MWTMISQYIICRRNICKKQPLFFIDRWIVVFLLLSLMCSICLQTFVLRRTPCIYNFFEVQHRQRWYSYYHRKLISMKTSEYSPRFLIVIWKIRVQNFCKTRWNRKISVKWLLQSIKLTCKVLRTSFFWWQNIDKYTSIFPRQCFFVEL